MVVSVVVVLLVVGGGGNGGGSDGGGGGWCSERSEVKNFKKKYEIKVASHFLLFCLISMQVINCFIKDKNYKRFS